MIAFRGAVRASDDVLHQGGVRRDPGADHARLLAAGSAATSSRPCSPSSSTCRSSSPSPTEAHRVPTMASVRVIGTAGGRRYRRRRRCRSMRRPRKSLRRPARRRAPTPRTFSSPSPRTRKDVDNNGCQLRAGPQEKFAGPDDDLQHVPFGDLISETIGRYSVRASLDAPEKFMASLAPLDADTRTLVHARRAARRPRPRWPAHRSSS